MAVLWLLIIVMFGVGIFALRGAIKNSFKDVELKKAYARMLRELLGETGYRYLIGIIGAAFIVTSVGSVIMIVGGKSLKNPNSKTNEISISIKSEDASTTSGLTATEDQLKIRYEMKGDSEFETYEHINFKNNYRNTLPDLIWKMKNLESIDLTNNEFTELPLQKLTKLPKLKRLILDGNPMENAYIDQIRSRLSGIQVVKTDVKER